MGGTHCLAWHLHPFLLAWLHVIAHQQTQQWPLLEERALSHSATKAREIWSSLKTVLSIYFLKLDLRLPSAWQPLGAASFRYRRSHLEHLIISGGADLCLTQHLQKVSHKPWQLLGGQRTSTMSLQDSVQTLAQAAVWTSQLLPAPVQLKQLIKGKHNTTGFSEPDLFLCI